MKVRQGALNEGGFDGGVERKDWGSWSVIYCHGRRILALNAKGHQVSCLTKLPVFRSDYMNVCQIGIVYHTVRRYYTWGMDQSTSGLAGPGTQAGKHALAYYGHIDQTQPLCLYLVCYESSNLQTKCCCRCNPRIRYNWKLTKPDIELI